MAPKAVRQDGTKPRVDALQSPLGNNLKRMPQKFGTVEAIRHALSNGHRSPVSLMTVVPRLPIMLLNEQSGPWARTQKRSVRRIR